MGPPGVDATVATPRPAAAARLAGAATLTFQIQAGTNGCLTDDATYNSCLGYFPFERSFELALKGKSRKATVHVPATAAATSSKPVTVFGV